MVILIEMNVSDYRGYFSKFLRLHILCLVAIHLKLYICKTLKGWMFLSCIETEVSLPKISYAIINKFLETFHTDLMHLKSDAATSI